MSYYIDIQMLCKHDACADSIAQFRQTFGMRAEVTPANLEEALAVGLDITWPSEVLWLLTDFGSQLEDDVEAWQLAVAGEPTYDDYMHLAKLWERYKGGER